MIPTLSAQLAVLYLVVSWEILLVAEPGVLWLLQQGAVAGGVAGQGVQSAMNKTQGVELEIRKDDGNTIMVVQKQGNTHFSPGQRVVLASNGSQGDRFPRAK